MIGGSHGEPGGLVAEMFELTKAALAYVTLLAQVVVAEATCPAFCPARGHRNQQLCQIWNWMRQVPGCGDWHVEAEGASEAELKKRTLTNLYNQRPSWLQHAHAALDRAVWAVYGWDDPVPAEVEEDTILARLLALNLERASGR